MISAAAKAASAAKTAAAASTALVRPSATKLKTAVSAAFTAKFPPSYSRILTLQPSTLKFGATKKGVVPFTGTTKVAQGAFVGTIDKGTKKFTGTYDLKTHAVTFKGL